MTLFYIGNTKIRINVLMLVLGGILILAGNGITFLTMLLCVFLHEGAHAVTASLLGLSTQSITLYLFGGSAEIKGIEQSFNKELIIAFAGPLLSLFSGFLWQLMGYRGLLPLWHEFIKYNYSIALINLLPIYPLDGGRILNGILNCLFGTKKGHRLCVATGIVLSSILLLKSLTELILFKNSSQIVMSVFIFISSLSTIKKPLNKIFRGYARLEKIKLLKAYDDRDILNISHEFSGNSFYFVAVFDREEKLLGILSEKEIFDGLLRDNSFTLGELLVRRA